MKSNKKQNKSKNPSVPEKKKPPHEHEHPNLKETTKITPEIEKEMLKGQEHIEENPTVVNPPVEEPKEVVPPPPPKKKIIIKPRETYLQEKISKMNCNKQLMSGIQKGLGDQVTTIIKDLKQENVLITQVPKDLNKYIPKEDGQEINKDDQEILNIKKKHKEIKELKEEQNALHKNLILLEQNEKLLKDESFTNIGNIKTGASYDAALERSLNEEKIKSITKKKSFIIDKLNQINSQINNLLSTDDLSGRKEKLKSFFDNFERDKEIAEIRAKKYYKESKERNQRIANDINQIVEKRKKEIEEKSKEAETQKEEIIKKFKEQERAIEQKRTKDQEQKALQYKPYINEKPEKKAKYYLFSVKYKNYQKKEEKIIEKEKLRRKLYWKSIPLEDIEEFGKKHDQEQAIHQKTKENEIQQLIAKWKKNKSELPAYLNPVFEVANSENNIVEINQSKREKKEALLQAKMDYGQNVRERQPEINEKLQKQRMNVIKALENPKSVQVKDTLFNYRKKRIILKKRDHSKPSKFKWKLKLEEEPIDKLNNSNKEYLIRRPKNRHLASFSYKKNEIPDKKIDYLKQIIEAKEEKKRCQSSKIRDDLNENILISEEKQKKWDKAINTDNGTVVENINKVKQKAETLEKEAIRKEQLLRINGGIENNPDLGKKISNLLIDSIEAKLSILNKMKSS